jgi:hypothetical protein
MRVGPTKNRQVVISGEIQDKQPGVKSTVLSRKSKVEFFLFFA